MSFSGRLSILDSDPHESVVSTSNSIIPLSIAQRINMESPSPPTGEIGSLHRLSNRSNNQKQIGVSSSNNIHDNYLRRRSRCKGNDNMKSDIPLSTVKNLAKELIETRAHLNLQHSQVRTMRKNHESQLNNLCKQLLNLESGLRKTEKDLKLEIQQKEKKIQEQAHIIEFLIKKANGKCTDIKTLCDEAVAKIPQIQPVLNSGNIGVSETKNSVSDYSVSEKNEKNLKNSENMSNSSNIDRRLSDTIIVNVKHETSQKHDNNDDLEMPKKQSNNNKLMSTTNRAKDLTSICEYSDSQNDNDSDSAIIIDDRLMSSSLQRSQYKGISRSISDVVSCISSTTPSKDIEKNKNDNYGNDNYKDVFKQIQAESTISKNQHNGNMSSDHFGSGGNEKGQNLPHPPSTCITSLLGSNLNSNWYSNEACGSLSPPLLLMRKHQSRMSTHLDTRSNSCSSGEGEDEDDDEMFVGDGTRDVEKHNKEAHDVEEYDKSPFTSSNYRGFLLRHGSYERYKSRGLYQEHLNNINNKKSYTDDNLNQRIISHEKDFKLNVQKRTNQDNLPTSSFIAETETTIRTPLSYCTLPRRSKSVTKLNRQKSTKSSNSQNYLDENQVHISNMSASSSTLIIVNQKANGEDFATTTNNLKNKFSWPKITSKDKKADRSLSTSSLNSHHHHHPAADDQNHHSHNQPQQIQIKHKNFMKPRDVKNRSTQKQKQQQQHQKGKQDGNDGKKIKDGNSSSLISKTFSQNIDKYIKKNGSVYCSLIMQENDLNSQSFA